MRPDPHAGKTPGLGCACDLCKAPILAVVVNPLVGEMLRNRYEDARRAWVQGNAIPRAFVRVADTRTLP